MDSNVIKQKYIVLSGLNQFYSTTIDEIISLEQIRQIFVKNLCSLSKNDKFINNSMIQNNTENKIDNNKESVVNKLINEFSRNYNTDNFSIQKFASELENYIRECCEIDNYDIVKLLNLGNYFSIDKCFLQSFIDEQIYLTITNKNPLFLYFEYAILAYFNLEDLFLFNTHNNISKQIITNSTNYLVCSTDLEYLYDYYLLNCWTMYLTTYVFNMHFDNDQYELNLLTQRNIQFIREKGKFFSMAAGNIIQVQYYISLMLKLKEFNKECSNSNSDINDISKLNCMFSMHVDKLNPVKVLYLHMIIFKKNELQKVHHYTSSEKIIFLPYLGFDNYEEIELNSSDFDFILLKFSTRQEYDYIKILRESLEKYVTEKRISKNKHIEFINSLKPMESFYHRAPMSVYLQNFCKCEEINKINQKYKTKTIFPLYESVNLAEIYEEQKFLAFLKEKNLELPLIIKHSGPVEFGHLLACVITKDGIKNYLSYIKDIASNYPKDELDLVIQYFFNHDGYFVKLFYINGKAYSYVRPSIPNLSENLKNTEERFEKGFYALKTDDLLTQQYLEFW